MKTIYLVSWRELNNSISQVVQILLRDLDGVTHEDIIDNPSPKCCDLLVLALDFAKNPQSSSCREPLTTTAEEIVLRIGLGARKPRHIELVGYKACLGLSHFQSHRHNSHLHFRLHHGTPATTSWVGSRPRLLNQRD